MNSPSQMFKITQIFSANEENWEYHFALLDAARQRGMDWQDRTEVNIAGASVEDAMVYARLASMAFPDRTIHLRVNFDSNGCASPELHAY